MGVAHAELSGIAWTGRLREPAVRGAQLLAASGFALAQPLFDILGKNAEFFAVRGSTPGDIVLFALVVTFVPALVFLAAELVVGLVSRAAGYALHLLFLGFLGAVFGVQLLKRSDVGGTTTLIVGALAIGVAIALAVWRVRAADTFLTVLAAAPVVFLFLFLLNTPVEQLVFPTAESRAATAKVKASTPVVFLLFDEFPVIDLQDRSGGIDAKRFPNFAHLAASSTWFRNTTTLSASTTVAVPAILTGNPPVRGALPIAHDYPNNLFTLLGGRYRMKVTEVQTRLCPKRLCKEKQENAEKRLSSLYSDARVVYLHLLAPPTLEERLPAIDESWGDFGQGSAAGIASEAPSKLPKVDLKTFYLGRVRDFNQFVASFRPPGDGPPTLYFLHVLLPHTPWLYFPDGRVRAVATVNAPGRTGERWWSSPLAVQAWQRHMLQVGYTDRLLGKFLRRLHSTGLWDKALVVVTADHGIGFRGGDLRRRPSKTNLGELAFTPLFVKLPDQKQGRVVDDRHVITPDILPTIADVLGITIPWKTTGRSAFAGGPGSSEVKVLNVSEPYTQALGERKRALARQLSLFGSGGWGPQLSGTGPYRSLVGAPVRTLRLAGGAAGSANVDAVGSKLVRSFSRRSPLIPSPLVGTLSGIAAGDAIALALDGRIAAVSAAYREPSGGRVRFSLLPPESAFQAGRNSVRLFVVSGSPARPQLREIQTSLRS
jgi:Sulfatase